MQIRCGEVPMPEVSIVIPTHDRPNFLKRALLSVVNQTFMDWEILVVQNGPDRGAKAVCENYSREGLAVRYLFEPRPGAAGARNAGIRASKGRFIAFLDDDDRWYPEKLETQVEVLRNYPSTGVAVCRSWEVDETGRVLGLRPKKNDECSFRNLVMNDPVHMISSLSGVMIRRSCFDEIGLFNESYRICDDVDLYWRLAPYYGFQVIPEPLFDYRVHGANTSRNLEAGWAELIQILDTLRPAPELGVPQEVIDYVRARYSGYFYRDGVDLMTTKRFRDAEEKFIAALSHDRSIGLKIRWSRYQNPVYRFLKPYAAAAYCRVRAAIEGA